MRLSFLFYRPKCRHHCQNYQSHRLFESFFAALASQQRASVQRLPSVAQTQTISDTIKLVSYSFRWSVGCQESSALV